MKILVKDVAKKLQTTLEYRNAEPETAGIGAEDWGKYSVLSSCIPELKDFVRRQNVLDISTLPAGY